MARLRSVVDFLVAALAMSAAFVPALLIPYLAR